MILSETGYIRRLEKLYAAVVMQAIKDVKWSETAREFLASEKIYSRAAKLALENSSDIVKFMFDRKMRMREDNAERVYSERHARRLRAAQKQEKK